VLAGDPSHGGARPSLLHFDGARWATRPLPTDPRMKHVANHPCQSATMMAVAAPPGGDVWALTSCNLWRFDGRRFNEVIPANPDNPVRLASLLVRSNDDVWVGGDKVLLHWNGKVLTRHPTGFVVERLWGDARELWAAPPVQRWNGSAFAVPPELNTEEMKKAQLTGGAAAGGAIWLIGNQVARWQAGRVEVVAGIPGGTALWPSPSGDLWVVGPGIKRGRADKSASFRDEDSAGLPDILAVGGTAGLVWAVGKGQWNQTALLFRTER
jgi:hypothetical protein